MDTPEDTTLPKPTESEIDDRLATDADGSHTEAMTEDEHRRTHFGDAEPTPPPDVVVKEGEEPRREQPDDPGESDDGDYRTADEPEPDNDRQLNPGGYDDRDLAALDDYPFALCDPPGALAPAPLGGVTLADTHQPWLLYRLDDYPRAIEAVRAHIDKCWRVRFRIQEWLDGERRALEAEAQDAPELTNKAKRQGYVDERMASHPPIVTHTRWLHLWKTEINRAEARVERLRDELKLRTMHMSALIDDDATPLPGFGTSADPEPNPEPSDE